MIFLRRLTADFSVADMGVTMFAYHFAKTLNREGIPQGFITMSSGQGVQMASPLSWTSIDGVKEIKNLEFQARLNELFMQCPNTRIAQAAVENHPKEVRTFVETVIDADKQSQDLGKVAPLGGPAFPEAGKGGDVKADVIPTYAYNWCVSPMTPMALAGVIWVPSENNIGYVSTDFAAKLEIYAKSLADTDGQEKVQFIYAQPTDSLLEGIIKPRMEGAKMATFDQWPKSSKDLAVKMARLAQ